MDAAPGNAGRRRAPQANLDRDRPELAAELLAQLKADIQRGRSTDGPAADIDVGDIVLWKSGRR